jgi:hypothetical protein
MHTFTFTTLHTYFSIKIRYIKVLSKITFTLQDYRQTTIKLCFYFVGIMPGVFFRNFYIHISSSFPFPFVPLQRRGCLVALLFL